MPPLAVDVRLIVPLNNIGLFELADTVGREYVVIVPEALAVHPDIFVTVTVYVVVVAGATVILAVVAAVLQRYVHGPPAVIVAVSVEVAPLHADVLLTVATGATAAVTVPLTEAVQPAALVAVTV